MPGQHGASEGLVPDDLHTSEVAPPLFSYPAKSLAGIEAISAGRVVGPSWAQLSGWLRRSGTYRNLCIPGGTTSERR
jgi:hypothetical protein